MSTAAAPLPLRMLYAAPRATAWRWVNGSVSVASALAAALLTTFGYQALHAAGGPLANAWVGAMLAILSVATAAAGLACGAADVTFGKGDRTLSVLGAGLNVLFGAVFYAVWI